MAKQQFGSSVFASNQMLCIFITLSMGCLCILFLEWLYSRRCEQRSFVSTANASFGDLSGELTCDPAGPQDLAQHSA